jgi:hypothetical protein
MCCVCACVFAPPRADEKDKFDEDYALDWYEAALRSSSERWRTCATRD